MDTTNTLSIDLDAIARQFQLATSQVRATVELLDEGNTVPFITRYRKDRTGGLDEEKIRLIHDAVTRGRQLNERKERILRSIQSQEKLTEALERRIHAATSLKTLEDLYLPYRPKKQTLATLARQRGLEPLALELLHAQPGAALEDLSARCTAHIDPAKELHSSADVLAGVRHILAEVLSERADLRSLVRRCLWNGALISKRIEHTDTDDEDASDPMAESGDAPSDEPDRDWHRADEDAVMDAQSDFEESVDDAAAESVDDAAAADEHASRETVDEPGTGESAPLPTEAQALPEREPRVAESIDAPSTESQMSEAAPGETFGEPADAGAATATSADRPTTPGAKAETKTPSLAEIKASAEAAVAARRAAVEERRRQRREARHRKRHKLEQSFKDYFNYSEPLKKLPHYRVLAINRGERCKVLRVKIQYDPAQLKSDAEGLVVPADHPQAELLREALHESLTRLVVPGIEREIRRELNDRAEGHAVKVFAQNLRKLLLQPPLRGHRVLGADPGFRSGCKLVALDEFGKVLGHTLIHVIGAAERVQQSRQRLAEIIKTHRITVVAIGNGTACRETEQLVASVLSQELADQDVNYLVVNEAGASVYSTSQTGREELPRFDATVRGAVSIGRRALDPLSELVKIDPASIGVGLYQHDVKAKHLRTSLDAVVESCVNYVGVDLNSASPALLGYVSGLNQLTARRLYEYRQQQGPFRLREQLKEIPGIGEATYVQAAGFLKIVDGENPLDATSIHPESYDIAKRVLEEIDCDLTQLTELLKKRKAPNRSTEPISLPSSPPAATESPQLGAACADGDNTTAEESVAASYTTTETTDTCDETTGATTVAEPPTTATNAALDAMPPEPTPDQSAALDSAPVDLTEVPSSADASDLAAVSASATGPATESSALDERLARVDVPALAEKLGVGILTLRDILASLARPGRDPREDLSPPMFRREVLKLEHLKPGMELSGTVLNVVDFGAFVDIGLSDSGLIHVSRLANHFVSDPHDVVSVGDILNVWVVEVDEKRRRVSLTALDPRREPHRQPAVSQGAEGERRSAPKRRKPRRDKEQQQQQQQQATTTAQQQTRRGGKPRRGSGAWQPKPKAKPKPVVPITEAMADGREPMRTFSDLQQFFQRKRQKDRPDRNSESSGDDS
jgi:uncharacterized protein